MKMINTPPELLRLLADTNPVLIAYMDDQLKYRFLNRQYTEWFGIDPNDYIAKTPLELLGERAFGAVKILFDRALSGENVIEERLNLQYQFGPARDVRFYLHPHRSEDGKVQGLCLMVLDITNEVELRNKISDTLQSRSRFLAAASHDLRQPLHAMTLLTYALQSRVSDDPESAELVTHLSDSLTSLRRMFDTLLDISKLDAGQMNVDLQVIDLKAMLQSLAQIYSAEAESQGLRFLLHPLDVFVQTDPAILRLTLSNLITNALKFTSGGGILLGCRRRDGQVLVEVYDTGPGVHEDRIDAIFEEFVQGGTSAHERNQGLGIGLSLVRRYCDLMDYDLELRTVPGKGSRFRISLLETSPKPGGIAAQKEAPISIGNSLQGTRILVLDDEHHVAFALSRGLADQGAETLTAERLEDADAVLSDGAWPDAAIVDYHLGSDETGEKFITRMEQRAGKSLPTLILTGSTDPESLNALAASGRKWLTKPVDPEVLSAAIAGLIHKQARDP